jgi:hypothetical protein
MRRIGVRPGMLPSRFLEIRERSHLVSVKARRWHTADKRNRQLRKLSRF